MLARALRQAVRVTGRLNSSSCWPSILFGWQHCWPEHSTTASRVWPGLVRRTTGVSHHLVGRLCSLACQLTLGFAVRTQLASLAGASYWPTSQLADRFTRPTSQLADRFTRPTMDLSTTPPNSQSSLSDKKTPANIDFGRARVPCARFLRAIMFQTRTHKRTCLVYNIRGSCNQPLSFLFPWDKKVQKITIFKFVATKNKFT